MRHTQFSSRRLVGAVGTVVAGLGAGQTADAVVVFQDFSPPVEVPEPEFFVDLGNDGVNEFRIGLAIDGGFNDLGVKADQFAGTTFTDPEGNPATRPGMAGVIMDSGGSFAANLAPGTLISSSDAFVTPFLTRLNGDTNATDFEPAGNFNDASGYIGVEFELNGNTHYGYVGYEGESGLGADGQVFKIGWEDTPGLGILAGAEESIPDIQGDFNGDGVVDAADYVVWRKTDASSEGYTLWRTNFGSSAGGAASGGVLLSGSAIPEPTSLALLAAGAAGLSVYRRRGKSKG